MGDISDEVINGEICQECLCDLANSLGPFPQTCRKCANDRPELMAADHNPLMTRCPTCGKRVKKAGLAPHRKAKHVDD